MYVKDGTRIRRRRRDKGLSQVQLAALARCTQQYISLIEQGLDRDISEKLAERICTYLDIELEDYFEERRTAPVAAARMGRVATRSRVSSSPEVVNA
jgi:transcriptional regulator with XRE-family HTH domain